LDSLFGILISQWLKILIKNKFSVSLSSMPTLLGITMFSFRNSFYALLDKKIEKQVIDGVEMKDPVFILGHWRSGTTFLHNILSLNSDFGFPRLYQVIHPNSFMYISKNYGDFIRGKKEKKRAMDNVQHHPMLPGEEEFALAAITQKSPIVGWVFPKNYEYYENYLCLQNIPAEDLTEWKTKYLNYLKKVTYVEKKQLILKSPTNTARIKFLLELFPDAKFIHIHRNPYNVFLSTKKLHGTAIAKTSLQKSYKYDVTERILSTYDKLYNCFLEDVKLLNKNNFVDISFEDLESDTFNTIKNIYDSIHLADFGKFKPALEKYIEENKDYKKNVYPGMEPALKEKIYDRWKKYFDYWGYSK